MPLAERSHVAEPVGQVEADAGGRGWDRTASRCVIAARARRRHGRRAPRVRRRRAIGRSALTLDRCRPRAAKLHRGARSPRALAVRAMSPQRGPSSPGRGKQPCRFLVRATPAPTPNDRTYPQPRHPHEGRGRSSRRFAPRAAGGRLRRRRHRARAGRRRQHRRHAGARRAAAARPRRCTVASCASRATSARAARSLRASRSAEGDVDRVRRRRSLHAAVCGGVAFELVEAGKADVVVSTRVHPEANLTAVAVARPAVRRAGATTSCSARSASPH